MIQTVSQRSYWALHEHIEVDILDKAFRGQHGEDGASDSSESSDGYGDGGDSDEAEMVNMRAQEETKGGEERKGANVAGKAGKGSDNSKIPLDPARIEEFSQLET